VGNDFQIPMPLEQKIPLRIALYIPSDVSNYAISEELHKDEMHRIEIGESISGGIEKLLRGMFNNVVTIDTLTFDRDVDAVIVPQIVSGDALFATKLRPLEMIIRVSYTAYDRLGKQVWSDTFQGECVREWKGVGFWHWSRVIVFCKIAKDTEADFEACMRQALEDHFRKAYSGMSGSEWWRALEYH
jgi:hypothetical protein